MTYADERARPVTVKDASGVGRCLEASKVRLAPDGHVSDMTWERASHEVDWIDPARSGP